MIKVMMQMIMSDGEGDNEYNNDYKDVYIK